MGRKRTTVSLFLLGLVSAPAAEAQAVYSLTPTYQASFHEWNSGIIDTSFRAWGVMAGMDRAGVRWSPHLWAQRYELGSVCPGSVSTGKDCRIKGWQFSVGPRIRFVENDGIGVAFVPSIGLDTRSTSEFSGGAGLHVRVNAGAFKPQFLGRFQLIRGRTYSTLGVGVSFEFRSAREPGADGTWGG